MSVYANDPRVEVRGPRWLNVERRYAVLKNDLGVWEAHYLASDRLDNCEGVPINDVATSENEDVVIRELIGDPK